VLKRLEQDSDALMESRAGMVRETLEDLAPEERHGIYKLPRLGVRFRPDWPWEITGVSGEAGRICLTANFRYLAYKGLVDARRAEGAGCVR
jgi:hypothetical protein